MSANPLVAKIEADARELAASLKLAQAAGVGPAVILPALVGVFREAGMFDGSLADVMQMMPGQT